MRKKTRVSEALYKALRPNAQPRFDTISRVCAALGGSVGCSGCTTLKKSGLHGIEWVNLGHIRARGACK